MASKKRTWPRRSAAADPHPPDKRGDRSGSGGDNRAKTSFPPSPRTQSETGGGDDAGYRDGDGRLRNQRPFAIEANDVGGDTMEEASDTNTNNARNDPGKQHCNDDRVHTSETPPRICVDAASPASQQIGTSTGGISNVVVIQHMFAPRRTAHYLNEYQTDRRKHVAIGQCLRRCFQGLFRYFER